MIKAKLIKDSSINDTTDWWDEKRYKNELNMINDCLKRTKGVGRITIARDCGLKKFFDYIVWIHDMEEKF